MIRFAHPSKKRLIIALGAALLIIIGLGVKAGFDIKALNDTTTAELNTAKAQVEMRLKTVNDAKSGPQKLEVMRQWHSEMATTLDGLCRLQQGSIYASLPFGLNHCQTDKARLETVDQKLQDALDLYSQQALILSMIPTNRLSAGEAGQVAWKKAVSNLKEARTPRLEPVKNQLITAIEALLKAWQPLTEADSSHNPKAYYKALDAVQAAYLKVSPTLAPALNVAEAYETAINRALEDYLTSAS